MRKVTRQFLEELSDISFFSNVGTTPKQSDILTVRSWVEAVECCTSGEWESIRIAMHNAISIPLSRERRNVWGALLEPIKPDVNALVEQAVDKLKVGKDERSVIEASMNSNLVCACIEWEYGDEITSHFYRDLAEWYRRGHFPCGWGWRDRSGELVLEAVEEGPDPADPDYLRQLFKLASGTTVHELPTLPPGCLVIY